MVSKSADEVQESQLVRRFTRRPSPGYDVSTGFYAVRQYVRRQPKASRPGAEEDLPLLHRHAVSCDKRKSRRVPIPAAVLQ